jgi:hypothetical protein
MSTAEPVDRAVGPDVEDIFDHWRHLWGKDSRTKLDPKRRRRIEQAVKQYGIEAVKRALMGYTLSPHHTGQNDRATVYDEIELHLRDAQHIEAGIAFTERGPSPPLSKRDLEERRVMEAVMARAKTMGAGM